MKKLIPVLLLLSMVLVHWSCKNDKEDTPAPQPEPIRLDRDSVSSLIGRRSFYVTDAWRFSGKDSVDLFQEDTLLRIYAKAAFLNFFVSHGEGPIMFHGGNQIANTEIPGNALTFFLNVRIFLPTEMQASWDDVKGTLRIEVTRTSSYFRMLIPGKTGYLDPASFNVDMTAEEAKTATVKPSMRFIYEDDDPRLGKVTYKVTMKPLYEYYRDPWLHADAKFFVYP